MKIKVTEEDINKGREKASSTCGCPIWHSVVRQLGIPESQAEELVKLPNYGTLLIGRTSFRLPEEAVSLQRVLVEYPLATIQELEFFAPVHEYKDKRRKPKPVVSEPPSAEVTQNAKPKLLDRIFHR